MNLLGIYNKELVAILHLLVAIIKYFKVQINLPENLSVNVIVVKVRCLSF